MAVEAVRAMEEASHNFVKIYELQDKLSAAFHNYGAVSARPSPGLRPPSPREGRGPQSTRKTALSLWERGDREAVGEGGVAVTIRHRNSERQY